MAAHSNTRVQISEGHGYHTIMEKSKIFLLTPVVLSFAAVSCFSPFAAYGGTDKPPVSVRAVSADAFEIPDSGKLLPDREWRGRTYTDRNQAQLHPIKGIALPKTVTKPFGGLSWNAIPANFPDGTESFRQVKNSWRQWRQLHFLIYLPEKLPEGVQAYFFTKTRDSLWRQIRMVLPAGTGQVLHLTLPITGRTAAETWTPRAHGQPWHELTGQRLAEFGCKLAPPKAGVHSPAKGNKHTYAVGISQPWLAGPRKQPALRVKNFGYRPQKPRVGELCTFSFQLHGFLGNPFDAEDVRITARIKRPDSKTVTLPGFYQEDFVPVPFQANTAKGLKPSGHPEFQVRYTPTLEGKYRVEITVEAGNRIRRLPVTRFTVAETADSYRGYIRVTNAWYLFPPGVIGACKCTASFFVNTKRTA